MEWLQTAARLHTHTCPQLYIIIMLDNMRALVCICSHRSYNQLFDVSNWVCVSVFGVCVCVCVHELACRCLVVHLKWNIDVWVCVFDKYVYILWNVFDVQYCVVLMYTSCAWLFVVIISHTLFHLYINQFLIWHCFYLLFSFYCSLGRSFIVCVT